MKYYGHKKFYTIIDELKVLHSKKNHDYATKDDPLSNFKECERMGISAWKGCLVRIGDKMSRIYNLTEKSAKNESIEDSFRDLAVYAVIALILYQERFNSRKRK